MKNLNYVGAIAFWVVLLGSLIFGDDYSSWQRERRNKKISEEGLQRLVDEYGLKIQNPIEDFNQCDYHYKLREIMVEKNLDEMGDKELIDEDTFMVNCIPIIQEVLDKCDCFRNDNECKFVHVDERKRSERDCFEESGLSVFK